MESIAPKKAECAIQSRTPDPAARLRVPRWLQPLQGAPSVDGLGGRVAVSQPRGAAASIPGQRSDLGVGFKGSPFRVPVFVDAFVELVRFSLFSKDLPPSTRQVIYMQLTKTCTMLAHVWLNRARIPRQWTTTPDDTPLCHHPRLWKRRWFDTVAARRCHYGAFSRQIGLLSATSILQL